MLITSTPQSEKSPDWETKFQAALTRRVLRKPAPAFIEGNRGVRERVQSEDELVAQSVQFFDGLHKQLSFYSERLGHDVMWLETWLKKWWIAWIGGIDHALVDELVAEDCVWKDPISFGREMKGRQLIVDYNQSVFNGVPDLRYDPIPGQVAVQVSPEGEVMMIARYYGCGHWDNPLRMYPFDENAAAIPGTGVFIRIPGVDRYHFNAQHQVCNAETLWDGFEALQLLGVLPKDTSRPFKAAVAAGQFAANLKNWSRRFLLTSSV